MSELDQSAVIKDSLTAQTQSGYVATTEECSVVKMAEQERKQWRSCYG